MQKPVCKLIGQDGNIFNLMGIACRALRDAGLEKRAFEMIERISLAQDYDEALRIILEYVEAE
jgi:hypothetical protein